jgi:hypothetical protein
MGLRPVHTHEIIRLPSKSTAPTTSLEDPSSHRMDQCSNDTTSHQPSNDLTDQQGHDLELELDALANKVLTCWWLGDQLTQSRSEVVNPH